MQSLKESKFDVNVDIDALCENPGCKSPAEYIAKGHSCSVGLLCQKHVDSLSYWSNKNVMIRCTACNERFHSSEYIYDIRKI